MATPESQDTKRITRRSQKPFLDVYNDIENLVGRSGKAIKHHLTQDSPITRKIRTENKGTQADLSITESDLTSPDGASEKYWMILAEKRQIALQEVLEENARIRGIIDELKQENEKYKQMLDEANSFIEVVKEELENNSTDDTGIDVNDISTAEDANEEDSNSEQQPPPKTIKTE